MHPNVLKELPVGAAAVFARRTGRKSLVRIAEHCDGGKGAA